MLGGSPDTMVLALTNPASKNTTHKRMSKKYLIKLFKVYHPGKSKNSLNKGLLNYYIIFNVICN